MKKLTSASRQRFQLLLTKALDGVLHADEKEEFDGFIRTHPECRQEWQEMAQITEAMKMMKFKNPSGEFWDTYWVNVYNRLERGLAWVLISIGGIILLAFSIYHLVNTLFMLFSDSTIPFVLRLGILFLIGGVSILLVSVIREKLTTRKTDPYKEVKR